MQSLRKENQIIIKRFLCKSENVSVNSNLSYYIVVTLFHLLLVNHRILFKTKERIFLLKPPSLHNFSAFLIKGFEDNS